jgi:UDP-glucose 4-epimerase
VRDVIASVEAVSGRKVPITLGERRAGDPATLVASSERIKAEAGWNPRYANLEDIVRTAFLWRKAHPGGYGDRSAPIAGIAK